MNASAPIRLILTTVAATAALACEAAGPAKTLTRAIELDKAEAVDVELKMTAGELHVGGGATRLAEASFTFNVPEWEPVVDYRRDGKRGTLTIRQPAASPSFRNTANKWDLRFADAVPLNVTATMTAGEATLTLGTLNLTGVQIDAGAGEVRLDLRGTPKRSYDLKVNAGVGEAHIRVPRTVGITATATTRIGEVNVSGLEKRGDTWVNAGHEQDPVAIRIAISGGVGEIHLDAE